MKKAKKSTIRTLYDIHIEAEEGMLKIYMTGSGFLYNMVRILSGTLLAIGTGEMAPSVIEEVFEEKDRTKAGKTLPACGLTLMEVYYE